MAANIFLSVKRLSQSACEGWRPCLTHLIDGEGDDVVDEDDRLHDAEEDVDDGHDDPRGGRGTRSKR